MGARNTDAIFNRITGFIIGVAVGILIILKLKGYL